MGTLLPAPRRKRPTFMLTPLVDVMFLLLIFFMLSSETSLYALLQVSAQNSEQGEGAAAAGEGTGAELIAVVMHGNVRLNGAALAFAEVEAAVRRFQAAGIGRAVVMSGSGAQVQDIVRVLELFEASDFKHVRLVAGPGS